MRSEDFTRVAELINRRAEPSLAADGAIACFSRSLILLSLIADRAAAHVPTFGGLLLMLVKNTINALLGALLSLIAAYVLIVTFGLQNETLDLSGRRSIRWKIGGPKLLKVLVEPRGIEPLTS